MVKKPVRSIVAAISAAAARWIDGTFAPRVRALAEVSARTGYGEPSVEGAFDRLFGSLERDRIEAVITDELGSLDVLDRFVERDGRPRARALPVGRVCVLSSRTTIGVAIVPAVFALCAKCDVLVKDREDHLVAAFFATLIDQLPELRASLGAKQWDGKSDAHDLGGFDAVVVFGSDTSLTAIAAQLPHSTRFIPHGSKASAGYVARDALKSWAAAQALAERAAMDLLLYETEGCLSLHALFVERGGAVSPEQFGQMFGAILCAAAVDLPVGPPDARRVARLAMARDMAAFRGAEQEALVSDAAASYLLVMDPPWDEPPPFVSRMLPIRSVDAPSQVADYFIRHGVSVEALAVAGSRADLAEAAARMGAARVTAFGLLQSPEIGDFHGGRPRIAEFVRWISDERIGFET
ncbi:MAG TPA: acyl-CoA reductase [Candidatus Binatia bacterium]|nr:acyl-CoA reductase [Candidatus Binatia bacterium]